MLLQEKPIHIVAAALLLIAVQVIVFASCFGVATPYTRKLDAGNLESPVVEQILSTFKFIN